MGKKISVDDPGTIAETLEEKESLCPLKEGIGNSGRAQGSCYAMKGEN